MSFDKVLAVCCMAGLLSCWRRSYWRWLRLFGGASAADAERPRDALAIGRVGFGAIGDVPLLDVPCGAADLPRGVVEQRLPLLGVHHAEQVAGLLVVVVIDPVVAVIAGAVDLERRFVEVGLIDPFVAAVGEI